MWDRGAVKIQGEEEMTIKYVETGTPDSLAALTNVEEGAVIWIHGELMRRGRSFDIDSSVSCYPLSGGRTDIDSSTNCISVELCRDQQILYRRKTREE